MKWSNVKLIFSRELRDQLRDRRTLFTVAVLPLLLYPVMGMALLQLAQFMREHPTTVWVIGSEHLPESPALIGEQGFLVEWCGNENPELIQLVQSTVADGEFRELVKGFGEDESGDQRSGSIDAVLQEQMRVRGVDLAVFIPDTFSIRTDVSEIDSDSKLSSIYLFTNSASDTSNIAFKRVQMVLARWQQGVIRKTLAANELSPELTRPFLITSADVANKADKRAAVWSKILPFIVMIWCLTGAFYPAVDLCAGEKERGTFETLLSTPAHRSEIAIGKLLTVILFSMATSILNLLSMGFTGLFVASRLGGAGVAGAAFGMGPPPLASIGWLLLALVPISALFSAMALAAAAFARSSKEGQYYLIPLMMICMPLMMLPMLPAAKLDFGSSLIPVTGLMLLLRGLMEGQYAEVLPFASPVVAVTLVCCWISIRWVVRQFNSETVLFRPSERFGVGVWMRQVMSKRVDLPSFGSALLCATMVLVLKFFVSFGLSAPTGWWHFSKQTVIVLLATVAMPAILMAMVLTKNARKSLRLRMCRLPVAAAAVLTALFLHPMIMGFTTLVMVVYPPSGDLEAMEQAVSGILADAPGLWAILLVFAVAPAIMEELAFRGFILSGFESLRNRWGAVLLSALFFGVAHSILQQSIITFGVGMILGAIAVQTRSLIPCVLYHATHNGITVLFSFVTEEVVARSPILSLVLQSTASGSYQYSVPAGILMSVTGILLFTWLLRTNPDPEDSESEQMSMWPQLFRKNKPIMPSE